MLRDEQQRLLPAHRATDRIDAVRIDVHAEPLHDRGHPGEIGDLARIAPRVLTQPATLAAGVDDGEVALTRQLTPEARVDGRTDPAPMRRDDQRDRGAVVRGRQQEPPWTPPAVVCAVEEPNRACRLGNRRTLGRGDGSEHRQRDQTDQPFHTREG